MKTPHVLLLMLLLMWIVLAMAAIQSGPDHAAKPHPVHGVSDSNPAIVTMNVGGELHAGPWAWLFGCLTILVLSGFLWLATDRIPSPLLLRVLIAGSSCLFLAVFSWMCWLDQKYAGGMAPLLGGFPEPTQWMITGIWCTPMTFMLIYVVGFRRWFAAGESDAKESESS
ncbi:MAG: hypothetical protein GY768_20330 [Planctomycetaceae bacterium]|nr:hypothetical protein [Planctomycetaceae bacterium]